jgi:hypothetical protein
VHTNERRHRPLVSRREGRVRPINARLT